MLGVTRMRRPVILSNAKDLFRIPFHFYAEIWA